MSRKKFSYNRDELNREIFISSTSRPHFYNVVKLNKKKDERKLVARIFKENGVWFIWYERAGYRFQMNSFGECLEKVEKEF